MSDVRPRVVLADLRALARDALRDALAVQHDVLIADSASDALATLCTHAPDLVLARVAPPALDGLDLLRRMRAERGLQPIPVILFAERADEETVLEGFLAGADEYLVEPFGTRALLAHVANQLRTGRIRREAAMREQQLAAVFEQAAVGIAQADMTGRHLLANQRYCDIVGRPLEEVLNLRVQDLTHTEDVAPNLALWQRMTETGAGYVLEKRYERPDGALMWVNVRVTLLRDPDDAPRSAIAVVQDITERKRAEEALHQLTETLEQRIAARTHELAAANQRLIGEIEERRQAEAALRHEEAFSELVIESSTEGIIAIDTAERHTVWNAAVEAMTGLPRQAVLGRTLGTIFPRMAGTPLETAWRAALGGRPSSLHGRPYSIAETGRSGVYDATFAPLHGTDGAIVGALGMLRDITEQRRVEEALRQAQKMEAVGQLTGGVAHDFNNLLTVVTGNLETMQRRLPTESKLHRQIEAALRGTERAAMLTHRLLAFSRR